MSKRLNHEKKELIKLNNSSWSYEVKTCRSLNCFLHLLVYPNLETDLKTVLNWLIWKESYSWNYFSLINLVIMFNFNYLVNINLMYKQNVSKCYWY